MSAIGGMLNLRVRRELKPIPEADYPKLTSEAAGIKYACENSGRQDKSIAIDAGTDPALLSKAKSGTARLCEESLDALMDSTGCEAPLYALLLRRGYDPRSLRQLESETERALREANERNAELERDKRTLIEALSGRAG